MSLVGYKQRFGPAFQLDCFTPNTETSGRNGRSITWRSITAPCRPTVFNFALKDGSGNLGEVDLDALVEGRPQAPADNREGGSQLFRIGDAVASRDIHAAIFEALRLCKDL